MFAWKRTDSYIPLGVVIFRRVILHLEEKAALSKRVFSARHEASGSGSGAGAGARRERRLQPGLQSCGARMRVFGNWGTQNLELGTQRAPQTTTTHACPGRVAGGLAALQGLQAGKNGAPKGRGSHGVHRT